MTWKAEDNPTAQLFASGAGADLLQTKYEMHEKNEIDELKPPSEPTTRSLAVLAW
jgi:hypothetical protein